MSDRRGHEEYIERLLEEMLAEQRKATKLLSWITFVLVVPFLLGVILFVLVSVGNQ